LNIFDVIPIGYDPPRDVNVIVEIPKGSNIKYELEKEIGVLRMDRVLFPSMIYPGNYGFIPQTLSGDGDAEDVLILGETFNSANCSCQYPSNWDFNYRR
jgi:inorganic pyrophosphatase